MVQFFIGVHDICNAKHFERGFISVNRLRNRKSDFIVGRWIMDSGAFTEVSQHGGYRRPVSEYADQIRRWAKVGQLEAAIAQDFMCEPFIIAKTGLSIEEHQRLTIERYDALVAEDLPVPIMPVLQGYDPADYVRHLQAYGNRLRPGMWVGVGSVCKRNSNPEEIAKVLRSIKAIRPDLRLHGFGIKKKSLVDPEVRDLLFSADSMAWSFHARMHRRSGDDWREAKRYVDDVERLLAMPAPHQLRLAL